MESGPCSDVCLSGGDNDDPSVCSQRVIKARKQQTCCECDKAIAPGESYEFVSGCWDGSWQSYRTCLICVEIRDAFCCNGYTFTWLWDRVREELLPNMRMGCLEKLTTAAAKIALTDEWRREHKLEPAP
jgi:hypothetical protein